MRETTEFVFHFGGHTPRLTTTPEKPLDHWNAVRNRDICGLSRPVDAQNFHSKRPERLEEGTVVRTDFDDRIAGLELKLVHEPFCQVVVILDQRFAGAREVGVLVPKCNVGGDHIVQLCQGAIVAITQAKRVEGLRHRGFVRW